MEHIGLHDAISRMRELTKRSIPFSFEYISCNRTTGTTDGVKRIDKAFLRTGMSQDKSTNSEILIGYTIEPSQEPRWFYLPLLIKFNGIPIRP